MTADLQNLVRSLIATGSGLTEGTLAGIHVTVGGVSYDPDDPPRVRLFGARRPDAVRPAPVIGAVTITNGSVRGIELQEKSDGFAEPPYVQISGGGGYGATAVACLSSKLVRPGGASPLVPSTRNVPPSHRSGARPKRTYATCTLVTDRRLSYPVRELQEPARR